MRLLHNPSVWIALVVLSGAGVVLALRSRGPKVPCEAVARRDLEQHIVASGRVMPPARVNVAALTAGLVVAVGVVEGQHVSKGDLLVQIDESEARAQVAQAKAAVSQASARVEQLHRVGAVVAWQGVIQAQSQLDGAAADLGRDARLAERGAIATEQLDEARRSVEIARSRRASAEAQRVGTLGADARVAEGALQQAQAQLTAAGVRLGQARLSAPHGGVVLTRSVEVGDAAQPARTLLVVANDGDVELVFQSDERNLASLGLGQRAKASADAFPEKLFDAEVSYIAPSIDPQRGTVEVRLRVASPPAFLRPDMIVSVDLLVATRKSVLVLPKEAVRGLSTPQPWVLSVEKGVTARRDVTLGIRGDGDVELASGLQEGALAIMPDGQVLKVGQRVRATPVER